MQGARVKLILLFALTACGESPRTEFACHRTDRAGTYLVHYEERAHENEPMCGALADTHGAPDDPSAIILPAWGTCGLESAGWRSDECLREIVYGCSDEQGNEPTATSLAEVTQQKDAAGSLIEGVLTRIVYQGDGAACRSEYDVTARRQAE